MTLFALGASYPVAAQIFVQPDSAKPGQRTITDPRVPQEKNVGGDIFNKPIVVPQGSEAAGNVGAQDFEAEREAELRAKVIALEEKAEADKVEARKTVKAAAEKARAEGGLDDDGLSIDQILDDEDIKKIISEVDAETNANSKAKVNIERVEEQVE